MHEFSLDPKLCYTRPNCGFFITSYARQSTADWYTRANGFVNNGSTDMPQYYYSSTQEPSSGTDSPQYDPPQTGTTGFADQAHYFVTQDHQPDYFVADPTAASSPASPSNLDQNHQINNKDQNPLLNFDYTQFYDCDGDDIKLPHRQRRILIEKGMREPISVKLSSLFNYIFNFSDFIFYVFILSLILVKST
ncbi:protein BEARSKIN1-like [Pyrus ussuriensis x Pyrus communis]|uniref:Protein BEARSKIN1-like n=1 Tax=Pyrus ussuriensis x Pyrus communis TaxID=2448454 RepID=A0A5N5FL26_9ROSA|nr:protein BEARSKIN1-like [Pyrus ussuriensis x Pyrus communis]